MRKKTPKTEKKNFRQLISHSLAIPEDMLLDIPRISISGNRELEIENYKNVLEYTEETIALNCKDYMIKICGRKLEITSITDEFIGIRGVISSISFTH